MTEPTPITLPAALQPEGGRSLREIAEEGFGFDLWGEELFEDIWHVLCTACEPGEACARCEVCDCRAWVAVVPLHLAQGFVLTVRALAEWCSLTGGTNSPSWWRVPPVGMDEAFWVLSAPPGREDCGSDVSFSSSGRGVHQAIPGISEVTDPASALQLACLAVCGSTTKR